MYDGPLIDEDPAEFWDDFESWKRPAQELAARAQMMTGPLIDEWVIRGYPIRGISEIIRGEVEVYCWGLLMDKRPN